ARRADSGLLRKAAASPDGLSRLSGGGQRPPGLGAAQRRSAEPADAPLSRRTGAGWHYRANHGHPRLAIAGSELSPLIRFRAGMQSLRFVQLYGRRLALSAVEDVRQRYAGSILGSLWAVLYPVATLAFYMIIYVYIFKIRPNTLDEYGYVVLVTSGLIPLMAFSECLSAGAGSLVAQRNLLLNTVFPAELIPLRAVLALQTPSL